MDMLLANRQFDELHVPILSVCFVVQDYAGLKMAHDSIVVWQLLENAVGTIGQVDIVSTPLIRGCM
jgi:hypothetical protein